MVSSDLPCQLGPGVGAEVHVSGKVVSSRRGFHTSGYGRGIPENDEVGGESDPFVDPSQRTYSAATVGVDCGSRTAVSV
jgi:hypothetical protein